MEDDSGAEEDDTTEELTLLNSRTIICKRVRPAVLKTPYISHIENPDQYYYSLLLMYFPFRNESTLLGQHNNPYEAFQEKFAQLGPNTTGLNNDMIARQEELQRALQRLELLIGNNNEEDLGEVVSSDEENDSAAQEEDGHEIIDDVTRHEILDVPIPLVSEMNLNERIRILNKEQATAFQDIRNHINTDNNKPLFYCLHGSGGTGKSYVARIIIDLINLQYNTGRSVSISPNVIVAAPTGIAAKNIKGVTCHSAFALPIEKFRLGEYLKLKGK